VWCRETGVASLPGRNPYYIKRFAHYVGRRCRNETVKDAAKEFRLDWSTVKAFEIQYMKARLKRHPPPKPRIIGIDEISLRKGHVYRVVVSDLGRRRPLFFGGKDRSEASLDLFYESLGKRASGRIRLAVMDMWKAFEASIRENAPQAAILFDEFHVLRLLNEALDKVRCSEYARIKGTDRRFIKGQKYALLSSRENMTLNGWASLQRLLKKNKRLYTAYPLKETFEQLWSYRKKAWARRFFDNWRESLESQRLPSYAKFAEMIERYWDGIAAYCRPENKAALGYIEGLNNKIRFLHRRAYGLGDEEYLRMKVLTCTLPEI